MVGIYSVHSFHTRKLLLYSIVVYIVYIVVLYKYIIINIIIFVRSVHALISYAAITAI